MTPAQEYKLSKIAILAECIIDIAKTLEKENLGLIQAATSIYNTAEQMKVDERILDDLKTKNDLETVKVVEENENPNITKGKVYFYSSSKPVETPETKEINASDFVEMFERSYVNRVEVLTKSGKVIITKHPMFPEVTYSFEIELGNGGYAFSHGSKSELTEFLNKKGILSYTLTKMEYK